MTWQYVMHSNRKQAQDKEIKFKKWETKAKEQGKAKSKYHSKHTQDTDEANQQQRKVQHRRERATMTGHSLIHLFIHSFHYLFTHAIINICFLALLSLSCIYPVLYFLLSRLSFSLINILIQHLT